MMSVKDVIKHLRYQKSIKPDQFLKEDFYSSPKYKSNPQATQN